MLLRNMYVAWHASALLVFALPGLSRAGLQVRRAVLTQVCTLRSAASCMHTTHWHVRRCSTRFGNSWHGAPLPVNQHVGKLRIDVVWVFMT